MTYTIDAYDENGAKITKVTEGRYARFLISDLRKLGYVRFEKRTAKSSKAIPIDEVFGK